MLRKYCQKYISKVWEWVCFFTSMSQNLPTHAEPKINQAIHALIHSRKIFHVKTRKFYSPSKPTVSGVLDTPLGAAAAV